MSRLILVYNPNSSNFRRVKKEILDDRANIFKGYKLDEYTVEKIGFENNVKNLTKIIKDKDLLLAVGGDATAAITANAIMKSEKDATLAVLPYGNFNDLARTLGTMKLKDLNLDSKPIKLYPLSIFVNDEFWRFATCYVTIGMTAEAVELFDEPKFRKYMQKGHKSSWRSYIALAKWYFKNRKKKVFLPEFTINGKETVKKASDYAAVNGKSMCRVMKGSHDFKKPEIFRSKALKTISFPRLFVLMARSILHRTPGDDTRGDVLEFKQPATVELQAEGEYQTFKDVNRIEIKKGNRCLKVIQKA